MKSPAVPQVFLILLLILIGSQGCLVNNITDPVNFNVDISAEILIHLESQGDYINSLDAFAKIDAQNVYENLNNYFVIDIRSPAEYELGHIQNSINISNSEILAFLSNTLLDEYNKIILVSSTGQAAAYYTCLLRLYGIENVFSLNYGMAAWNNDFADIWFQASRNRYRSNSPQLNNITYPKSEMTSLPFIPPLEGVNDIHEIIYERIEILMNMKFHDNSLSTVLEGFGIDYDSFKDRYEQPNFSGYVICLGEIDLYYIGHIGGMELDGHLPGVVLYKPHLPFAEFKSANYLQTLPPDEDIYIYSYNGQNSAYQAAYLRLLGYNVYSILFGAQNMFWGRVGIFGYDEYYFIPSDANNFPYETE